MRGLGRGGWAAALGSAAAMLMLIFPSTLPAAGSIRQAVGGSAHVLIFAVLAWLWGRALPVHLRGRVLWGALALFSASVEWIQPCVGRSAEWTDWLYGAGGAACICGTWRLPWRRGILRWAGVLVLFSAPLAWALALREAEIRVFPSLAEPGALWARGGWVLNGVRISAPSEAAFRIEGEPWDGKSARVPYPGVFRAPARSDWRGMRSWRAELFWPGPAPVLFAVRVDDRPGNPPYAERFQREFAVTQGWNAVEIPAEELGRTSGGRPMRLDQIHRWGVFLVSNARFDYFLVGAVRLELKEDRP